MHTPTTPTLYVSPIALRACDSILLFKTDPCGLQLFHLLSHTEGTGGATLLVDGFYVASIMKELYPKAYDTLSRIGVPAHAAGEPGSLYTPFPRRAYPVLRHDGDELVQVRWNNDDRSVMDHLNATEMEEWYVLCHLRVEKLSLKAFCRYEAIRLWHKLLTSPDSEYWVQLSPGTAVGQYSPFAVPAASLTAVATVVNNHRVLHGRSAFTGKRRMCGAYIGVDEYRSKLAVLTEKFSGHEPVSVDFKTCNVDQKHDRSVWSHYL